MAADLERSKVACRVRLILWLPLFLINGWEIEKQERGREKINSVILFPLPFYRCRNKILLLWDSSFGSFSPLLMHFNSLPSFLFSPLGLTLLFHWCAVAHSLSALLLAGILMRLLCFRYSASSVLRLSHTTTTTTMGRFHWTVEALECGTLTHCNEMNI